jgi:hypothetical protein
MAFWISSKNEGKKDMDLLGFYARIAGFFSSSLLEVAGEALERMTPEGSETCVRVEWICDLPTEAFSKNIRDVDL